MDIIRNEVRVFEEELKCTYCEDGRMQSTNEPMILTSPPLYPHKCNRCGQGENRHERFPRITYETPSPDVSKRTNQDG